jgi:hypothetical protein
LTVFVRREPDGLRLRITRGSGSEHRCAVTAQTTRDPDPL